MNKITAELLRSRRACSSQVELFEKEWPNGTRVTKKACLRAAQLGLDFNWFARKFFPVSAWIEYFKALNLAWDEYDKATELAGGGFNKAKWGNLIKLEL